MVDALTRLRLVNRSNLEVQRMFYAMLIEGKKPPEINEAGQAVGVSFTAENHSAQFLEVLANEGKRGVILFNDSNDLSINTRPALIDRCPSVIKFYINLLIANTYRFFN